MFESIDTTGVDSQLNRLKNRAKELMYNMSQIKHEELSLNIEDHCLHLKRYKGAVLLVLAELMYPQALAFQFLGEIQELLIEELQKKFGTSTSIDYSSKIEMIDAPYAFQSMERAINKVK